MGRLGSGDIERGLVHFQDMSRIFRSRNKKRSRYLSNKRCLRSCSVLQNFCPDAYSFTSSSIDNKEFELKVLW